MLRNLTEREIEVVKCIAAGMRQKEIGSELGIALNTVKAHLNSAYNKTGQSTPVELTLWAVRKGIITVEVEVEA
jgi:DNA-binding NarL/FixJ family response regulator